MRNRPLWCLSLALAACVLAFCVFQPRLQPASGVRARGPTLVGRDGGRVSQMSFGRSRPKFTRVPKSTPLLGGGGFGGGGGAGGGRYVCVQVEDGGGEDDEQGDGGMLIRIKKLLEESGLSEDKIVGGIKINLDVIKSAILAGRVGIDVLENYIQALKNPLTKLLVQSSDMMRDRLVANPFFFNLLGIEIGVGLGATLFAQIQQRKDKFIEQLDFVCADLAIVVAANIALVTALSPLAPLSPPATGRIASTLSSLPSFVAQNGPFSPMQRVGCFLLKGSQFAVLGGCASAVGQGVAKGLVTLREKLNPGEVSKVQLSPIGPTALNFGVYMFASSNPRYQVVNALEQSVLPSIPSAFAKTAASTATRVYNNYLGGVTWIWWARWRGLQKAD
ncbi:hypothetical protein AAMO2058_000315500 [Amorphochlora amoebiformis]